MSNERDEMQNQLAVHSVCSRPELLEVALDGIARSGVLHFPPIGEGNVDFAGVLSTLERGGDKGTLSIEIEYDNGVVARPRRDRFRR